MNRWSWERREEVGKASEKFFLFFFFLAGYGWGSWEFLGNCTYIGKSTCTALRYAMQVGCGRLGMYRGIQYIVGVCVGVRTCSRRYSTVDGHYKRG